MTGEPGRRLRELLLAQTPAQERTVEWLCEWPEDTLGNIVSMVEDARQRGGVGGDPAAERGDAVVPVRGRDIRPDDDRPGARERFESAWQRMESQREAALRKARLNG